MGFDKQMQIPSIYTFTKTSKMCTLDSHTELHIGIINLQYRRVKTASHTSTL